jgi:carbonic anhydrase/acetyltransferase-like protein (isoleucine patch superfamily)
MANNDSALPATGQRKYELLEDQSILFGDTRLYRIRALKDFGDVKTGDLGGYIQAEKNLSQAGTAWVSDNARVFADAQIVGAAQISDAAWVFGSAQVSGMARVSGKAWIFADAQICDTTRVGGNAQIGGKSRVLDKALVAGDTHVFGKARIGGKVQLSDRLLVSEDTLIPRNSSVSRAWVTAGASVAALGLLVCAAVRPASVFQLLLKHPKT